jgi:hypothetical protein
MGQIRAANTPIPLLTSPLKGEELEPRRIDTFQEKWWRFCLFLLYNRAPMWL